MAGSSSLCKFQIAKTDKQETHSEMSTNTDRMDSTMREPVKNQPISLGLMDSISETLANLVRDMLGPGGQQTLLSTPTGKVLVTRDGSAILSSLHLAHPVAKLITQSLRSHHLLHHDGSKTFILYLSQILKDIKNHLGSETGDDAVSRVKLSLELNKFLCVDFKHIEKLVVEKVTACAVRNHDDGFSVVKAVLKTSLQTCLQKQMVPFFTDILVAFLSLENLEKATAELQLAHVLQHFDMYHSKVCTQPQQKSRVCKGILLETNLQTICQGQAGAVILKRFALMDVNFGEPENVKGENTISIHLSSDNVVNLLSQKRTSLERVLKTLKSAGVHVLLCSETVPQFMHGLCKENGITVQCLTNEKLMFLRDLTGVSVLTDLTGSVPSRCFFTGRISSFVHIGRKIYTMIELAENSCPLLPLNHLVVCAPTEGLCDQLCQSLYKALKAVSECWKPSFWGESGSLGHATDNNIVETHTSVCAGEAKSIQPWQVDKIFEHAAMSFAKAAMTVNCGGTFEAVLGIAISDYYTMQNCHPLENVDSLIQKMLLSVPRALHANLCSGKYGEQHQFTEKWTSILSMVHKGHLVGLGIHGAVTLNDYIEPVETKLTTVASVLQLAIQLLRVEAVVPVKRLPTPVSAGEPTDEEKEHEI